MKSAMESSTLQKNELKRADAHLLWCLGDWTTLDSYASSLETTTQPELGLYIAAAQYQLGKIEQAEILLKSLELDKEQKKTAAELLISGVYNSIGKAHACAFNHEHAALLFTRALDCALPKTMSNALRNPRSIEQYSQLGIPQLADNIQSCEFTPDAEEYFLKSEKYFKNEPAQQIALAELYQQNEHYEKAIIYWQNVSGLLNVETPQLYYDRLKDAYKSVKGFPQGSTEQETLSGDTDKHHLLNKIHEQLQPEFYFEIGVQMGKSLALAKCEALGVDPMPMVAQILPTTAKVITSSSDTFFMQQSDLLLHKSIDFSFIDGMHLFEYALRDFINVEKYAQPYSLVVIDDIFPGHPDQAKRERNTRAWTGDVWKVKETLEKYRPDLFILAVDAYPTGLLLISALDPNSTILTDNYQTILNEYSADIPVPDEIMLRKGAISGSSEVIDKVIGALKLIKHQQTDTSTLKNTLRQLVTQQSKNNRQIV